MDAMDAGARHATRDASDRLLKAIVENLNGGVSVVVYDEDGGVRHAYKNDRYYEMFGYTPEQFAAEKNAPYAIVVPEDARYVRDTMARVRETGKPASFQYRARKRDGREIFVACHTSVASVEDINETLLLSVMTDITELIETNEQLEAERERIDDLMNTAPGGIAVVQVDPENVPGGIHTLFYNDSFYSFSGYSREEYDALLRENEMHFVFDEDVQTLIDATRAICAGEARKPVDSIVRCRTKDGGYRWLLLTGQLVSRRGSLCDITVVLVDITERKNAEDRQRISGDMLRIAAETDKRTIITYDVKANTCHFESRNLYSAKYGEMLEDVPQSLIDVGIVAQESTADVCALFERIRRGDMTAHASLLLRTGNQEYQWFECNASAVLDADGCPDHAVLVLHNITEQRVKEAVYRKWRNSIESRPPETYTLFRSNLSQDASIDRRDGALLKIEFPPEPMSFNARTQLYVERYVHPDDREAYAALLDSDALLAMYYRGEHAATLEYREQSENGAVKWRLLTVELVEYLYSTDIQVFLLYEDIDDKKNAELKEKEMAETDPLTGVLNRVAFSQRVEALISQEAGSQHALLMMDMDGFKRLNDTFGHAAGDQALLDTAAVIRSLIRDGDLVCRLGGDEFLIWLRGIPYDAVIDKTARQLCAQARKAFSHDIQISVSIGVSVYPRDGHDFDELYHSADMALQRVKRAGKNNYAFFSASERAFAADALEAAAASAPLQSDDRTKRRMLIVDDDAVSRESICEIFREEYLIETAKNGNEAMLCLRHFSTAVSIVLLDLLMPVVDGYEVLRRMQVNDDLRTIPVIVVSASEDRVLLSRAIESGAADCVTKPVDSELLRARVKFAVSRAENERLRAQNSYLQLQRDEEVKFHMVLESTGTVVIEYDWRNHVFSYASEIGKHIAGTYNHRSLWQVLLADRVASSDDVKAMQGDIMTLANDRERVKINKLVMLKTPSRLSHWFRMNIYKRVDAFGLAEKMIITFNDVHEEVLASERLLFQATRDELTGLYNRAGFIEKAAEMIAAKDPGYYALSCVDIEKFKVINDQYGTDKGDEVLRLFAGVLASTNGGEDMVCCRIMADHFAILYPSRLMDTAELTALHTASERLDGSLPPMRIYAGRCIVDDKTLDVSAVYDRAAIARDTVKGRYDAYFATYDESMRTALLRQQEITGQMKSALETGQFEVWLQPQFNHATGALSGAEALVRWRHPKDGLISPAEFIPIFEQNGFIYELDQFVWEEACRLLRKWLDKGLVPVPVSVNISRYDIFREGMVAVVERLVEKYSLPRELLCLEITESAFSESAEQIIRVVKELVTLGFVVEIDDFGSGYSSLNTLKDVPAQVLKLDMRFLENDTNAQRGGSIIESVARMARWLGMSIIAEGVETKEQADYLKSIGCEFIQGYLYSRPTRAEEYERLLSGDKAEPMRHQLDAVDSWNNNAFWNPRSIETLIFNSYVGGACIFEYHDGKTELMRYNDRYAEIFRPFVEQGYMTGHNNFLTALDDESVRAVKEALDTAIATRKEAVTESRLAIPGGGELYVRATMRLIAQAGDRRLFYCVVSDITARRQADERLRFVNELASEILAESDNDRAIEHTLQRLMAYFDAERGYIVELDFARGLSDNTYEVCKDGVESMKERLRDVPFSERDFWYAALTQRRIFIVEDVETLEDTALRELLRMQSIRSLVLAPLWRDGRLIGFAGVDNPAAALFDIQRLTAPADYLALLLNRRDLNRDIERGIADMKRLINDTPGGYCRIALHPGKPPTLDAFNEGFCRVLDMTRDEVRAAYGDNLYDCFVMEDVHASMTEARSARADNKQYSARCRVRKKSGEFLWVMAFARFATDAAGNTFLNVYFSDITGQKNIEEMLPVALSVMLATSDDIAFIKDTNGKYIACSKAAVAAFGRSSEREIIGKTSAEVFGDETVRQFEREDRQVFETGKPLLDRMVKLTNPNGVPGVYCTSKYPLLDGNGHVIGVYSVCRNVTAEKTTEFELHTLLRVIPSGVLKYSADEKAEFAYVNRNFMDSLGYTEQQFLEKFHNCFRELIWHEDRAQAEAEIAAQEQDGKIGRFDYRVEAADGQLHWFHDEGVKIADETGKEWYYVTLVDVTAQRKSENSLRLAEEEYRLATRHSGHTIGRYDIRSQTLTITEDAATRLALPECIPDVPYGRVRLGKISADTAAAYIAFYESIMHGAKEGSVTFKKLLSSGWRWITERATTIFDEDGEPVSAIISYSDVTDQQEKELVYKRWQQSMEGRDPKTYTLFRCNLNSNTAYDTQEGALLTVRFDDAMPAFNDRTAAYVAQCVYEDDREAYLAFMNADTMLAEHYRGHRSDAMEYREITADGGIRWLKLSVDLVEAPHSADVEAYLLYENIDDQKKAELETAHMAQIDPLTGLYNRKAFSDRANALIQRSKPGTRHAFMMLDIDGFKMLNDTFGHAAGDEALVEASHTLQSLLRKGDLLGRLGGDEFVLFLSDISSDMSVGKKAQQICNHLYKPYSAEIRLSASVGVSLYPRDGADSHALYEKADIALYAAKEFGRNTYKVYAPDMPAKADGADNHAAAADTAAATVARVKRRMLIVDADAQDQALLQKLLKDEYAVDQALDGATALTRMRHFGSALSIVLLDARAGNEGLETLKHARGMPEMRGVPVIVMSDADDRATALSAIRCGATDMVVRPLNPELLRVRVAAAVSRAENERLRAQNCFLQSRVEEAARYQAALDDMRMFVVEMDARKGAFAYDAMIARYLKGRYDSRKLFQILVSDGVASAADARALEERVKALLQDRDRPESDESIALETPSDGRHSFDVHMKKTPDNGGVPEKLVMIFRDRGRAAR